MGIKWRRFDDYWGGKPYLDGIEMVRYADINTAIMDFRAGNLDIITHLSPDQADQVKAEGKYRMVIPKEGQAPGLAGYAKDPNSPFAKLEVRQALAYAIDAQRLASSFGRGYYILQTQWAVPGTWGYNPNVVGYAYNPEKAKELLAEAGYPNGFDTTLSFYNTGPLQVDESVAMQEMLKEVGIRVKLNPLQRPAYAEAASLGKGWDGIIRMQGYSSPDPLIKYAQVVAGLEYAGIYLNDEIREAYAKAIAAPDQSTKQKLTHEFLKIIIDKYCICTHLYITAVPIFKSTRLHDDLFGEVPNRYLSPKAWLSE